VSAQPIIAASERQLAETRRWRRNMGTCDVILGPGEFKDYDAIIDARTPAEYALDHIPGAVSAPVLDDAERAEVGTLYKQVSPFEAKKLGAALIAKNVAGGISTRCSARKIRAGIRSSIAGAAASARARWRHILREVGWQAEALQPAAIARTGAG